MERRFCLRVIGCSFPSPGRRLRPAPRHCPLNCVRACSYAALALSASPSTRACADQPQPAVEIIAIGRELLVQPVDHGADHRLLVFALMPAASDPSVSWSAPAAWRPCPAFGHQHGPPGRIGGRIGQEGLEGRLGLRRLALLFQRERIEEARLGQLGIERQRLARTASCASAETMPWPAITSTSP